MLRILNDYLFLILEIVLSCRWKIIRQFPQTNIVSLGKRLPCMLAWIFILFYFFNPRLPHFALTVFRSKHPRDNATRIDLLFQKVFARYFYLPFLFAIRDPKGTIFSAVFFFSFCSIQLVLYISLVYQDLLATCFSAVCRSPFFFPFLFPLFTSLSSFYSCISLFLVLWFVQVFCIVCPAFVRPAWLLAAHSPVWILFKECSPKFGSLLYEKLCTFFCTFRSSADVVFSELLLCRIFLL